MQTQNTHRTRILVGMSGGLDSTCAARKLLDEGFEVEGAIIIFSDKTETDDAKRASELLNIKLNIIDARDDFSKFVISRFCSEYLLGRTPNPCVFCNPAVKFASLCRYALENGFDFVASGHYAKIGFENGRYFIIEAFDGTKDQSYMLAGLSQEQLKMIKFPLGECRKEEIRSLFPDFDRPESEDICFIPNGSAGEFVEKASGKSKVGNFVFEGKALCPHKGIANYTVGQRKNLGVSAGQRIYVEKIDNETGDIFLSKETPTKESISVSDLIFQASCPETQSGEFDVRVRYHAKREKADVVIKDRVAEVKFKSPVSFCAPGQAAVFYLEEKVAFSGIIN